MAIQSDIKIRLPADLKKQFDQACRTNETTMTAQLIRLIQSSVASDQPDNPAVQAIDAAVSDPEAGQNADIAPEKNSLATTEILLAVGSLSERMEELVDAHPQFWFQDWADRRVNKDGQDLLRFSSQLAKHHAAANEAIRDMRAHITAIGRISEYCEPPFYQDYKIWTAAGAGVFAILLVLALLPGGSAISRFTAVKMVGGANPIHAAKIIAGGKAWTGGLIVETAALMKSEPFASSFANCIERAKRKPKPSDCTVKFPILVEEK